MSKLEEKLIKNDKHNQTKIDLNLGRHFGIDFSSILEAKMEPSWEGKSHKKSN